MQWSMYYYIPILHMKNFLSFKVFSRMSDSTRIQIQVLLKK